MQKWKRISSKILYSHPRMTLTEDQVELPNGEVVPYLRTGGNKAAAVTVIAIQDGKVLLQQEYSYPPDEILYQFPGGAVEKGEELAVAANRELTEESGYKAAKLEQLGWYYIDNRRTDTRMYVYLATELSAVKQEGGDKEEFIESSWVPLASISGRIANGDMPNFSVLAAWALYMSKQGG